MNSGRTRALRLQGGTRNQNLRPERRRDGADPFRIRDPLIRSELRFADLEEAHAAGERGGQAAQKSFPRTAFPSVR